MTVFPTTVTDHSGTTKDCLQTWQLFADGSVWTRLFISSNSSDNWELDPNKPIFIRSRMMAVRELADTNHKRKKRNLLWDAGAVMKKLIRDSVATLDDNAAKKQNYSEWEPSEPMVAGSMSVQDLMADKNDHLYQLPKDALDKIDRMIYRHSYFEPQCQIKENNTTSGPWFPVPGQMDAYDQIVDDVKAMVGNATAHLSKTQQSRRSICMDACAKDLYCQSKFYLPVPQEPSTNAQHQPFYVKLRSPFVPTTASIMLSRDWIPGKLDSLKTNPPTLAKPLNQLDNTAPMFDYIKPDLPDLPEPSSLDVDEHQWQSRSIPDLLLTGTHSPTQPTSDDIVMASTQPSAGLHGSRGVSDAKKKKKKKKIVSGFM
ncbi:hypothetical protein DM01DRAFT_1170163 [Hesseltinella vesiculosa]|uniref:Uncharacterized protein n=1 Tax=Hesseltinella vesiculosa TaxID=101127 RepID=A0A1X2G5N2_9FUNG|nr:hypothetical protein DM01DRAFT_1170163 [Hesseltinella vesiculosa]